MAWDIGLALLTILLVGLGVRMGVRGGLLAAAALGLAFAAGVIVGTTAALAAAIGGWLVLTLAIGAMLAGRRRHLSPVGGALGLAQAAIAAILIAGAAGAAGATAALGEGLRSAKAYPAVAEIGIRMADALPDAPIAYPAPIERAPAPEEAAPPRPVDWAVAEAVPSVPIRHLTGTVRAADRAVLGFEVDGRVAEVRAAIGDRFAAGDVLAVLDAAALEIALEQAQAALVEAEVLEAEAARDFERQAELFARGIAAEARRDDARAALDAARSRLAVARTRVADAADRLEEAVLVAPYDGRVAARLIEPAQLYRPGEPAFEVESSRAGFEVEVTVPETLVARLVPGSRHEARLLDGSNVMFEAELREIGSRALRASGFPVTFAVFDAPAGLRAGMAAEVGVRLRSDAPAGLVSVPLSAVAAGDGAARIVFVHADGRLVRRVVEVAGTESDHALITHGLAPGEAVATNGLPFLRDGMRAERVGVGVARYDL